MQIHEASCDPCRIQFFLLAVCLSSPVTWLSTCPNRGLSPFHTAQNAARLLTIYEHWSILFLRFQLWLRILHLDLQIIGENTAGSRTSGRNEEGLEVQVKMGRSDFYLNRYQLCDNPRLAAMLRDDQLQSIPIIMHTKQVIHLHQFPMMQLLACQETILIQQITDRIADHCITRFHITADLRSSFWSRR